MNLHIHQKIQMHNAQCQNLKYTPNILPPTNSMVHGLWSRSLYFHLTSWNNRMVKETFSALYAFGMLTIYSFISEITSIIIICHVTFQPPTTNIKYYMCVWVGGWELRDQCSFDTDNLFEFDLTLIRFLFGEFVK